MDRKITRPIPIAPRNNFHIFHHWINNSHIWLQQPSCMPVSTCNTPSATHRCSRFQWWASSLQPCCAWQPLPLWILSLGLVTWLQRRWCYCNSIEAQSYCIVCCVAFCILTSYVAGRARDLAEEERSESDESGGKSSQKSFNAMFHLVGVSIGFYLLFVTSSTKISLRLILFRRWVYVPPIFFISSSIQTPSQFCCSNCSRWCVARGGVWLNNTWDMAWRWSQCRLMVIS